MTLSNTEIAIMFLISIGCLIPILPLFMKLDPHKKTSGPIILVAIVLCMIVAGTLTTELIAIETPGVEKPVKWIYKQCDEATGECFPLQDNPSSDIITRGRK